MTGRPKARRGGFKSASAYSKKRSSPDDDDAPQRSTKKAKGGEEEEADETGDLVPKLQKDEQGDFYVALKSNGLRRVTVSEFKGKTMVNIREYYTNDAGKMLPGKKGISLTLDQYNAFVAALPLLESVIAKGGEKVVRPDFDAAQSLESEEREEQPEEEEDDEDDEGSE